MYDVLHMIAIVNRIADKATIRNIRSQSIGCFLNCLSKCLASLFRHFCMMVYDIG